MGFNTAVLVLNDALHYLRDDPDAGRNLHDAIIAAHGRPVDVRLGPHVNGATVLPSEHADFSQVIVVGGNMIRPLATILGSSLTQEDILRKFADDLGFYIARKPSRQVGGPR